MNSTNLGRVRINPRGQYLSDVEYSYLDRTTNDGSAYLYINPAPGTGKPLSDGDYWLLDAAKGGPGKSAFDAAVEADYPGTEEQFNEAMATLPTAVQDALDAADDADEAAGEALQVSSRLGGLSFAVDPLDGGLNVTYTPA